MCDATVPPLPVIAPILWFRHASSTTAAAPFCFSPLPGSRGMGRGMRLPPIGLILSSSPARVSSPVAAGWLCASIPRPIGESSRVFLSSLAAMGEGGLEDDLLAAPLLPPPLVRETGSSERARRTAGALEAKELPSMWQSALDAKI